MNENDKRKEESMPQSKLVFQNKLSNIFVGRLVHITHKDNPGLEDALGVCKSLRVIESGVMVTLEKDGGVFGLAFGSLTEGATENSIEGPIGGQAVGRRKITVRPLLVEMALAGHHVNSPNIRVDVEVDGEIHPIWGHSVPHDGMEVAVPVVELLREYGPLAQPEAEENFQAFAEQLIRDGAIFYTVLHKAWHQPAMLWDLNAPPPLGF
ncbi:MAG: hypothetical protein A3F25_01855 [Candidatus Yanofskybacteria bacterium RIFCSPHIGHO2_12_FULL_45_19b]|uniref:Uncharacterized protein n=1 Tax=Candidatus Yanofskybacteria bacterium RIFCSPHIGHO2_12_FULL_45_19b TaxID=1802689 RepID=A0A1F8G407_9BACT|nr:MAG: hypothetical protein A3F25_01855 [Candidatus Yanofskybacteria bacterium RIFCSPHIGHO2_12_FULL_45_19b]